ncbi:esterase [Rhizobium sp. L9]|uniref:extracellular catalytic domain type 1 short-chain-length polyhydroxyalkanoate depolymerase n=1 Tax=Rhizobium sp. L9 TaxID=1340738 RepID=UPI000BEA8CFD|nr:PHB depolymerase family esterase [Rhizobium sp. L9]PDT26967.1 esterase [Rhizobium sp. L9]
MNDEFAAAMRRATLFTRASNPSEATRVILDTLAGRTVSGEPGTAVSDIMPPPANSRPKPFPIDPHAQLIEPAAKPESTFAETNTFQRSPRVRRPLGDTLRILSEGRSMAGKLPSFSDGGLPGMTRRSLKPVIPDGAQYLARSFTCAAGTRSYKLYVPASAPAVPRGLVVMLHGCKQDPDDFAIGTDMNAAAEANGLVVAYPGQTAANNASSCWNWFQPSDQRRGAGEPAIIAGITEEIIRDFELDRSQIFVAGLSAGGAMAAVMAEAYPDLYAAVGIHSGLACGSATDVVSAFTAMRGEGSPISRRRDPKDLDAACQVRTIVFHGDADRTVHPSNADRIVATTTPSARGGAVSKPGRSAGGLTYETTVLTDENGRPALEYWLVNGAGHAWSGGHADGSYTDPRGPNATTEMVRFFLDQCK